VTECRRRYFSGCGPAAPDAPSLHSSEQRWPLRQQPRV
jgi:hypothetical protein